MKTYKLACLIVTALFFAVIYPIAAADPTAPTPAEPIKSSSILSSLSVEAIGAIRYDDLKGPATYGAGADVGYAFNKYVIGHARLLTYETDDWRGSAIDEGSLLAEAKFLRSANGRLSLSGIGGVHRDFDRDDWGFGIGARGTAVIWKNLSAFAQGEIRAWFSKEKDGLVSAGLQLAF